MKHLRNVIVASIATFAGLAGTAGSATAASPVVHGTGTYAVTGAVVHSARQVGAFTIVQQTLAIDNAGVLSGPSSADVTCAFAADGRGACFGTEQFSGTIGGRTGSATFGVGITVDAAGFHGAFATLSADGQLAGLRGAGTFDGGLTGDNAFDYVLPSS